MLGQMPDGCVLSTRAMTGEEPGQAAVALG